MMHDNMQLPTLNEYAEVFDVNGNKLGHFDHLEGSNIIVRTGVMYLQYHAVPLRLVARADPDNVYLSVTGKEAYAEA